MHPVPIDEPVVTRLVEMITQTDGRPPFSEHKRKSMSGDRSRAGAWSDTIGLCVVGVAAFHEANGHWAVEIAVAPDRRDPRMEEAAIRVVTGLVTDTADHTIWAFRTDQIEAAMRLGYREIRSVLRMAGPIPEETDSATSRVTIGAMESVDIVGLVAVNNRAFRGHPEQGAMTEEDFGSLVHQPWFDPAAVFVAKAGERVAGFCITKYEGDGIGEIFVIAVDPVDQQSGIGRDLIGAGFDVLRSRGVRTVHVWVDEANEAAVRFYGSLGLAEDFRTRELALS